MHCNELKAKLKTKFADSVQDSQVKFIHYMQIATRAMTVCKMCRIVLNVQNFAKKQKVSKVEDTHTEQSGHTKSDFSGGVQCAVQIIFHKSICFDSEMYLSNLLNVFVCVCRSDVVCRTHIAGQRAGSVAVCSPSPASPYPPPPRQRQPKLINT